MRRLVPGAGAVLLIAGAALAIDMDRLKVQRKEVFAFTEGPTVTRSADTVTVTFAAKDYCDATVAIEEASSAEKGTGTSVARRSPSPFPRIVRHLASGVLGPNAPAPFTKNALRQTVVWDGKDDRGRYIEDKDRITVRISLGLMPQFERSLFYSPYKRFGRGSLLMDAGPEGVYVYEQNGDETIRLFNHQGNYVRSVYPFPADRVDRVKMPRLTFPDGLTVPAKRGHFLMTMLTGPESGPTADTMHISSESVAMTIRNGRIALTGVRLNRMATDGTSGGLALYGPRTDVMPRDKYSKKPRGVAFSPDTASLYLTRVEWLQRRSWSPVSDPVWQHCVYRMAYAKDEAPTVFLGEARKRGKNQAHFDHPADVAVDAEGRIYVADHLNDRVQVFGPDGTFLKTISVDGPALVRIHAKTREVYVFSWFLSREIAAPQAEKIKPALTRFGPFPGFERRAILPLPLRRYATHGSWSAEHGFQYRVALDSWSEPTRIWMVLQGGGYPEVFEERKEGLVQVRDLLKNAKESGVRLSQAPSGRQRLYVDPHDGALFLAEGDCGTGKAFTRFVRIDPETGRCRIVELPFSASDAAFAPDGHVYLRTGSVVGRYDPARDWTEVPFDYGENGGAHYNWDAKGASLKGGLRLPSSKTNPNWHHGGMDVNARGDLLVTCYNSNSSAIRASRRQQAQRMKEPAVPYRALLYPGRWNSGLELHVFDPYGRVKHRDILRGQPAIWSGATLDVQGNVYVNVAASRMVDGRPYYRVIGHPFAKVGTLIKFKPGAGKFTRPGGAGVPIRLGKRPTEPMHLHGFWVEGAEWFYPGVGRAISWSCSCANSRFVTDYYARSFAPEYDRFSVAVLDTNGNLIARIGKYGNVEDGKPLVPAGGPPHARSIGGDEVALFDACYVATHTDRRLFVADAGNARIVSVRLQYHTTERAALKDVGDGP